MQHYFTDKPGKIPSGHTSLKVLGAAGETLCNFAIKKSPEELKALRADSCQLVVNQDYRPPVIASVLKAAHLTMFSLLRYRHVFSPAGLHLASILREYFLRYGKEKKKKKQVCTCQPLSAVCQHDQPNDTQEQRDSPRYGNRQSNTCLHRCYARDLRERRSHPCWR